MSDLKPCPFCGGEAYVWNEVMWHVGCDNMSCVAYSSHHANYYTRAEAIEAWNTRAHRTTTRSGKYKEVGRL